MQLLSCRSSNKTSLNELKNTLSPLLEQSIRRGIYILAHVPLLDNSEKCVIQITYAA